MLNEQFLTDIHNGLSQEQKTIPSKYFYNQKGDELFEAIMKMPEYYPTPAEQEILELQSDAIISAFQQHPEHYFELIELGAGNGSKTQFLLKTLLDQQYHFDYMPVDISANVLKTLETNLKTHLPELSVVPQHGDYFKILEQLMESTVPKVVLFLGSNIGNMTDPQASQFLKKIDAFLTVNDKLLLSADQIKSADIILPAYNDKAGITRDFNLNLLHRINDELGANFDVDAFAHHPEYCEKKGIAYSYLVSKKNQDVTIDATGKSYAFYSGEKIHTEISRKYNDDIIRHLITDTRFSISEKFSDTQHYFIDYLLTVSK